MTNLRDFARPDESLTSAIARAVREGRRLCSYESPTEEAREGLSAAEAEEIASEDPGLVRVEGDPSPESQRLIRARELLGDPLFARFEHGDGCLWVSIDAALRSDPTATAEEIAAGLAEAEEDARIEREREVRA